MTRIWDVAIVGAGPAGAAAALAALAADPRRCVVLLDRSGFPRDKPCGDGVAPHVFDLLADVGVVGMFEDWKPVWRLRLCRKGHTVSRAMSRPARVVPRSVFDSRLVSTAQAAGAVLKLHRVRRVHAGGGLVHLDDGLRARVVVGADGASSLVRTTLGLSSPRRRALALRGYAPVPAERAGQQVMVFDELRQPSYAWSFDRGDGLANVGYGELLRPGRSPPARVRMLNRLEDLLPGATVGATAWRGHHLPLASWSPRQPDGPVLLAGDAAGLVNPLTGEGIYYAVATGLSAGRAAVEALAEGDGSRAGSRHRQAVRCLLAEHLRHVTIASRLGSVPALLDAGLRAAERDAQVFDDLVELGLGRGRITRAALGGLVRALPEGLAHAVSRRG